jgi:FkbM family methyltransferase
MFSTISIKKIPKRIFQFILKPIRPYFNNRIIKIRNGPARGLFRKGGLGFIPALPTSEEKFLTQLDLNNKTIYDIGANIGIMSLFFLRASGKKGFVNIFEPNSDSIPLIEENLRLNNFKRYKIFNTAIGESDYKKDLVIHNNQRGSASLNNEQIEKYKSLGQNKFLEVNVTSLDSLIKTNSLSKPDFIKIDTEGYEYNCLLGMDNILTNFHPTLYIEMHGVDREAKEVNAENVCKLLSGKGYKIWNVEYSKEILYNYSDAIRGHLFCS